MIPVNSVLNMYVKLIFSHTAALKGTFPDRYFCSPFVPRLSFLILIGRSEQTAQVYHGYVMCRFESHSLLVVSSCPLSFSWANESVRMNEKREERKEVLLRARVCYFLSVKNIGVIFICNPISRRKLPYTISVAAMTFLQNGL